PAADPIAVAFRVIGALDALGVASTVGGSIAASFAGEPRSTFDIDVIAAIDERQIDALVAELSPEFYIDPESLRRAIRTKGSTNLIHQATQYKVDLFVAGGTPLDTQQLARRHRHHQDTESTSGSAISLGQRAADWCRGLADQGAGRELIR